MVTLQLLLAALLAAQVTAFFNPTSPTRMGMFGNKLGSYKPAKASTRRDAMSMNFVTHYEEIQIQTDSGISVHDVTEEVASIVDKTSVKEGVVTVLSKHSTVGISINEMEGRLVDDIRQFFLTVVDPNKPWLHNDLDYRVGPPGYPGGDEAWRDFRRTQPVNTHSHLIAMMLGTSESIPISEGKMKKGTFQNIMVIEADGFEKKKRTVCIQVMGTS